MKYTLSLLVLTLAFITTAVEAQVICEPIFIKEYAAAGHNLEPFVTKMLPNGEVLIAGKSSLAGSSDNDAMIARFSGDGTLIWNVLLTGNQDDRLTEITLLNNGNFLLSGSTDSFGYVSKQVLLVYMKNDGTVICNKILGFSGSLSALKAIIQLPGNDIAGCLNVNDSTPLSNPVVFKMDLNGNIKWAKQFDKAGEKSFTSIAFENDRIYVSGFYTDGKKKGVITKLNSADGTIISAENLLYNPDVMDEEVTDLEIFDNKISYGLWEKNVGNSWYRKILIQQQVNGNTYFETIVNSDTDSKPFKCKRTKDDGFLILRNNDEPHIVKLNRYNTIDWSAFLFERYSALHQINNDFDETSSGGCISAGYSNDYYSNYENKIKFIRLNAMGLAGNCTRPGFTFFTDTVKLARKTFQWTSSTSVVLQIDVINPPASKLVIKESVVCDTTICKNATPLPPECNKTSLHEYQTQWAATVRDFVTMDDGSKIVVGEMNFIGFVARINNNGSVAWSKRVEEFSHNSYITRIIKAANGDIVLFINDAYIINHQAFRIIKVLKIDSNGNLLEMKELNKGRGGELGDVTADEYGGFVTVFNKAYGLGYLYSAVIRYNANLQVVWQKELRHSAMTPIYKSIVSDGKAVYIGLESYDWYNKKTIGIEKLDFATGSLVWTKRFSVEEGGLEFSKLIKDNNTLFAFFRKTKPLAYPNYESSMAMLKLTPDGDIIEAVEIKIDNLIPNDTYYYLDVCPPVVTMSADKNFIFSSQVKTAAGQALNISKFDKNGNNIWCKNYTDLDKFSVYNIHSLAAGAVITGTVLRPTFISLGFRTFFVLQVDSAGEIKRQSPQECAPVAAIQTHSPLSITEAPPGIDSVVNLLYSSVGPAVLAEQQTAVYVTPYCIEKSSCNQVTLIKNAGGCSNQDTLSYYLQGNDCGAIVKWKYDTAFFKTILETIDTLRIVPVGPGVSMVKAELETTCFTKRDSALVAVNISANFIKIGNDTIICSGSNILLHAGPGYTSYVWSNGSIDSNLLITVPGQYFVKVKDNCGRTGSDTILVTEAGKDFHISGRNTKCNNDTLQLAATFGYTKYKWSPSNNIISAGESAVVFPVQTQWYFANAEVLTGCTVKDSILVTVKTSPVINLGADTSICFNTAIQLKAPGTFLAYTWSTGKTTNEITVSEKGQYSVRATYTNGCYSADTINIAKYLFLPPALGNDTSVCNNPSFKLNPGVYERYLWSDLTTNSTLSVYKAGPYWVKVTDKNGCSSSDTIFIINLFNNPASFLPDSLLFCYGDQLLLSPSKVFQSYSWSTGETNHSVRISKPGDYLLNVTDFNACRGADTVKIVRNPTCPDVIFFVNAFSPNADRINETFRPVCYGVPEKYELKVYNYFGELVFSTSDFTKGWNGEYKNKTQPVGNYVFICTYKFYGSIQTSKRGNILLLR